MNSAASQAPHFPAQRDYSPVQSRRAAKISRAILEHLTPLKNADVCVRLWDESYFPTGADQHLQKYTATLVLKHPGSLRAMFQNQDGLTLAETYLRDLWDIEGDIEAVFDLSEAMSNLHFSGLEKARLAALLFRLPSPHLKKPKRWREPAHLEGKPHSIERDKAAIAYHYNAGNEFYKAFLDERMVYSCGEFLQENDTLEQAQINKFEGVCQQLQLQSGQKILDVGCGWGGFMIYAAQKYGVDVVGITLSEAQAQEATERIKAAGLENRCRVQILDYREIEEWESFDAIASIEMFEHVGREMLTTYFSRALRLLKPGGLFLNQGTTVETDNNRRRYPEFIKQYVFPDGEVVPIHVSIRASEESGFEVLNVRSIRQHYVKTCGIWARNLEAQHEQLIEIVGEPTWRIWRLYTAVSGHGFKVARLNCYQTLMRKL